MKALITSLLIFSTQSIKIGNKDDDYDFYSDAPTATNLDKDFAKLSVPDKPVTASAPPAKENVVVSEDVAPAADEVKDEGKDKKEQEIKKEVDGDSTFFTSQADITKKEKDDEKKKYEPKAKSKEEEIDEQADEVVEEMNGKATPEKKGAEAKQSAAQVSTGAMSVLPYLFQEDKVTP